MDKLTGKWARLSLNTQENQTILLAPTIKDRLTSNHYLGFLRACGAPSMSSKSKTSASTQSYSSSQLKPTLSNSITAAMVLWQVPHRSFTNLLKTNMLTGPPLILHLFGFRYITFPSAAWTKPTLKPLDSPWDKLNRLTPPQVVNVMVDMLGFGLTWILPNHFLEANSLTWVTQTCLDFAPIWTDAHILLLVWPHKPRWKGLQDLDW